MYLHHKSLLPSLTCTRRRVGEKCFSTCTAGGRRWWSEKKNRCKESPHILHHRCEIECRDKKKARKRAPAAAEYLYKHISHMDSAGVCSGVGGFDIHPLQRECNVTYSGKLKKRKLGRGQPRYKHLNEQDAAG